MVRQALDNPTVKHWFTVGIQVKTEAEILLPDGSVVRPDRIVFDNSGVQVIDYKFGEWKSEEYHRQIRCYMEHLRNMDCPSVKGFLWYVTLNEVEEVA